MWKVHFAMAYDSLDHNFLWLSMQRREFLAGWIKWIKRYVTIHAFSILVNGRSEGGWINIHKGP